jgi:hypothetical protein
MIRRQGTNETNDRRRSTRSQETTLTENDQKFTNHMSDEEKEMIRKRSHDEAFSSQIMTSAIVASAWGTYRQASPDIHKLVPGTSPRGRIVPKPLSCKCKLSRSCTAKNATLQGAAFCSDRVFADA